MNKMFKAIVDFFRIIYHLIDKVIVTPISKFVYRVSNNFNKKTGGLDKLLNRPNFLLYASLILAVIVFVLIDSKVIDLVENEAEVLTNVPLIVKYNDEAYVVEGIPEQVDVILTGRKSDIYLAKQLGDHEVVLDLTDYGASSSSYKVKLTYTKAIDSLSYKLDPSYVTVTIKNKISKTMAVNYDLLNTSKLDQKLSVKSVELAKTEVTVKGSEETLASIASIKALIDLSNESFTEAGTFNIDNVPLVAYDEKGLIIDSVTIVSNNISASVTLETYSVNVPLTVLTTGELVTGKAIASILINNNSSFSLDIYGEQEKISEINNVPVTINVDGLGNNSTKTYNVNISKPNGVRYMSTSHATITVTFGEEKQKTIEVNNVKYKNLSDGLTANATSDTTISVQVKGVQSVIDSLNAENISAYVDLSSYKAGDYEVEVAVDSNDARLSFVVLNKINIKISGE